MSTRWKIIGGVVAVIAVVIVIVVIYRASQPPALTLNISPAPTSAEHRAASQPSTAPAGQRIKVAVYLSEFCAKGANGTQWAYGHSCQMVGDLHDPALEVVPLIEPGTENAPDLAKVMHIYFHDAQPADATDPAVLKTFDVLVLPRINYIQNQELDTIEQAVESGVGLLIRNTFANGLPGYTPQVAELNGFQRCGFDYAPHPANCTILADNPLLGSLHKGDTISLTPNGVTGNLSPARSLLSESMPTRSSLTPYERAIRFIH